MDIAVDLVSAYLQLNGYFVKPEVPVLSRVEGSARFRKTTDIDILAVRFPSAVHLQPPRERAHWAGLVAVDPALDAPEEEMDVVIGEVKEGRSRLNPALRTREVLEAALWHSGGCMPADIDPTVDTLLETGEARARHCHGGVQRIRLMAFGGTRPDEDKPHYRVIPLSDVLAFLRRTIADNPETFGILDVDASALGMLLLLDKMGLGAG